MLEFCLPPITKLTMLLTEPITHRILFASLQASPVLVALPSSSELVKDSERLRIHDIQ